MKNFNRLESKLRNRLLLSYPLGSIGNIGSSHKYNNIITKRFYVANSFYDPFSAPIPYSYTSKANRPFILIFNIGDLDDFDLIRGKIENFLPISTSYMAYIKLRYGLNSFCMCGNQFPFDYKSIEQIESLFQIVNKRIEDTFDEYKFSNADIVYVQLSFRKLDVKLLAEFTLDKSYIKSEQMKGSDSFVKRTDVDTITTTKSVPVSLNEDSLGTPLKVEFTNNIITNIQVTHNNVTFNFLDKIKTQAKFLPTKHKDKITEFDSSFKFYFLFINTKYYVLATKFTDNNKVIKITYFLDGTMSNRVVDTLLLNNTVSRLHGNTEFLLDNNNVVYSKHDLYIKAIEKPKVLHIPGEDSNIGVIDLETFKDNDDKIKVYALGFKTNLAKDPVMYYFDNTLTPRDLIIKLVNELFRSVYNKTTFYSHNFGGYDSVYIINALLDYNESCDRGEINDTKFIMSYIFRDKGILKLTIKKELETTSNNKKDPKPLGKRIAQLVICDSLSLLNNRLDILAQSFGVKTQKGIFPYKFALRSNLFYVGNTPHKNYYKSNVLQSDYDKMISNTWSFKDETQRYLRDDLLSLHEVITKANKQVFIDYKVNMIESLTISGLALKIFRRNYHNNNIPLINKTSMYRDIKQGYYGAITEVYKPYGEKLYYYDVNSLYPYVALQDLPGTKCSKENFIGLDVNIDTLFGFYYCCIESPKDSYLGLLPMRDKDGLRFPLGK